MADYSGEDWLDLRSQPVPFASSSARLSSSEELHHHRARIQSNLRTFLPPHEARDTATQIYRLALDTEEEIGRILKDPAVAKLYAYDGQFFAARHMRLFHTAFDGLHVLRSLGDSSLAAFFRGRERHGARRQIVDAVGMHAWTARLRRMNWEEFRTLGLVPPSLLDEIAAGTETEPPAMSLEEQSFFQAFEKQMG